MNILVTGATGFVGRNLINKLITFDYNVFALIRKTSNTNSLTNKVKFIEIHQNPEKLAEKLRKNKIEGIIHLAVSYNNTDVKELIDSNITLPTMLLSAGAKAKIKWFINTGTFWQHYNGDEYNPVNIYAATKKAFEDIIKFYLETSSITICTLKLNDTYGPNDTRNKILKLWGQIAVTGESLAMTPGEQFIDILHVDDVANAFCHLVHLISSGSENVNGISFYISSGKQIQLRELAKIFETVNNVKLNIKWGDRPYPFRQIFKPYCSGTPLPGWEPQISLGEGVKCK